MGVAQQLPRGDKQHYQFPRGGKTTVFVGFNGQNRNILHVLTHALPDLIFIGCDNARFVYLAIVLRTNKLTIGTLKKPIYFLKNRRDYQNNIVHFCCSVGNNT